MGDLEQLILMFPDKDWDWECISYNPNITMKFILDNPDKPWDWGCISLNNFNYSKKKKIVKLLEKRFINRLLLRKLWIKIEELIMIKYHPDTDFIKEYIKF
jgi:hypothetical protein